MSLSEDEEGNFVPFSRRPEWNDVERIPLDEGSNPPVPIVYSEHFAEVMDYFRGILRKNEYSERALELTAEAISCNPGNYTVWVFRRKILLALKKDLSKELDFLDSLVLKYQKCYQLWHHRECIVDILGDGSRELEFTENALMQDSKNYHAWQYRQWVVQRFLYRDADWEFVEKLIQADMRNNSAWNERFYLLKLGGTMVSSREKEIGFAFDVIRRAPNNESPWNYLRGLVSFDSSKFADFPAIEENCRSIVASFPACPQARSLLIDCLRERATVPALEEARETAKTLMERIDTVRRSFWEDIEKKIQSQLENE